MHTITIHNGEQTHTLTAKTGEKLRDLLLAADLSPYTTITARANCGGRGICATCGVWIASREPDPQKPRTTPPNAADASTPRDQAEQDLHEVEPIHWHDRLARSFGYPRLSCQIVIDRDLIVHLLPNKLIWGSRARGKGPFTRRDQ